METGRPAEPGNEPPRRRLASLDLWRGVVMVLMALDHANVFIGFHPRPEGLAVPLLGRLRPEFPSMLAWVSRQVTHYCAPSFFFLAGASAVLLAASRRARGVPEAAVSAHLLLRGAVLIVLEYTLVAMAWGFREPMFLVLAALGACIACGAVLRFMPLWPAVLIGLALLFAHPYLAEGRTTPLLAELPPHWRRLLFRSEPLAARWPSLYPVVPWLSVFLLGIGFGRALVRDSGRTLRWLGCAGAVFLAAWLALRLTGGFGHHAGTLLPYDPGRGWQDLFMMSKYPPSADFVLWTLGGAFLFCWLTRKPEVAGARVLAPVRLFGSTALFFYVTHLFVYRWLCEWLLGRHGGEALFEAKSVFPAAYTAWVAGLLALLPLCWLWAVLKRRFPGFPLDLL
jgi:uncharacterized membrane protein